MLSWLDIVQRYIIKYSNQIQKTTKPLKQHFGIDYFTYHRIDKNGLSSMLKKANILSIREKECLRALLKRKTAKETAEELILSPRTIESYFENIKNKLSCYSIKELLRIAEELDQFGLIA